MLTLAHLSDPHLAPLPRPRAAELFNKRITGYLNWQRKRRFIHDRSVLDRLAADLKAQAPDHIAVTGDIVNIALAEEFARGRDWLEYLGSTQAVSFIPGNHDAYVPAGIAFAESRWGPYMRGDEGGSGFPYVRRRGPVALIGLSSGVPTAPFMATGRIGPRQLAALDPLLDSLKEEGRFRVILIHHPPVSEAKPHKRLIDADLLIQALARHGAELLLHGHDHRAMLNWLPGPERTRIPAIGVPSASASPKSESEAATYNLYAIDHTSGAWRCDMISRGAKADGTIGELKQMTIVE